MSQPTPPVPMSVPMAQRPMQGFATVFPSQSCHYCLATESSVLAAELYVISLLCSAYCFSLPLPSLFLLTPTIPLLSYSQSRVPIPLFTRFETGCSVYHPLTYWSVFAGCQALAINSSPFYWIKGNFYSLSLFYSQSNPQFLSALTCSMGDCP